jgi:hypothetical protein
VRRSNPQGRSHELEVSIRWLANHVLTEFAAGSVEMAADW